MIFVYVFPIEYDTITEATKEDDGFIEELENHKPLCFYVMNKSSVDEDNAIFKRLDLGMQQHLKLLFIWAKVANVEVSKNLADGGTSINLMPPSLSRKIGKYDTYLKPHNMVLFEYERKVNKPLGVLQVDVFVETTTKPTLFLVITTKVNYNLLIGCKWNYGA